MNIIYLLSAYPSLTETFIAREISQMVKAGAKVNICILRRNHSSLSSKAIMVENVDITRFNTNLLSFVSSILSIFRARPFPLYKVTVEAILSMLRKPIRAHHILYFYVAAIWFSNNNKLQNYHFIHCHFLHSESITARWLSLLTGIPYGISAHIVKLRFDCMTIKRVVKSAKLCVCDTNETMKMLRELGSTNPRLIRNGIYLNQIQLKSNSVRYDAESPAIILAIGSLIRCKGFHVLIKACNILNEFGISFKCKIIGEGIERSFLEALAHNLKLEEVISMPGAMAFDELLEQYNKATIMVMPSIPTPSGTDGLPTVIIEAMAAGLPIVGTRHAAIPEIIIHGKTGLLVNPLDENTLALSIINLLENKTLYNIVSKAGREKVETEFDIVINSFRLFELINEVIIGK